ncbi:MAG: osmotically inducible protein OsmC [Marinilabiliales bacterium]|nr:MAG: osmotically inducible protein OsmC [Marinilabiliales bacterium]
MTIEITLEEGKKVNANIGGKIIKTDQSVMSGGEGSAPEPFSLFLASIGTCAGIYVKSFCEQRGIDTKNVKILQHMDFNQQTRMIDRIDLEIKLPVDFPEKYKKAVISAADLCAVKKHLNNPPEMGVTAVVG